MILELNNLSNQTKFIKELYKTNKKKLQSIFKENSDIEFILCYSKMHNLKFYPNYVKILTYTRDNESLFWSDKKLIKELNSGILIYIIRNGGDMVVRDDLDVAVRI